MPFLFVSFPSLSNELLWSINKLKQGLWCTIWLSYIFNICILYIDMCIYIYIYIHIYVCIYIYVYKYILRLLYVYIYIHIYIYIYIYIYMSSRQKKWHSFTWRFALQLFLTIILQDMLKFNDNFQKSLKLNNKKCLQLFSIKEQNVYLTTLLRHSLLINSFHI